jgi:hypothetical protein
MASMLETNGYTGIIASGLSMVKTRRYPLLNELTDNWTRAIERLVHAACLELQIKPLGTHAFRAAAARL